jgi:hypothetical protein
MGFFGDRFCRGCRVAMLCKEFQGSRNNGFPGHSPHFFGYFFRSWGHIFLNTKLLTDWLVNGSKRGVKSQAISKLLNVLPFRLAGHGYKKKGNLL